MLQEFGQFEGQHIFSGLLKPVELSFAMPSPQRNPNQLSRRELLIQALAQDIIGINNNAVARYASTFDPAVQNQILVDERDAIAQKVQPFMKDKSAQTPTSYSPQAQTIAQEIQQGNIQVQGQLLTARAAGDFLEVDRIEKQRRKDLQTFLEDHLPKGTNMFSLQTARTYARREYDRIRTNTFDRGDAGCSAGCGCLTGLVLMGLLALILSQTSCATAENNTTPSPSGTSPTSSSDMRSFSIAKNSCMSVPINSVIKGDVTAGGHVVNGKIVGGDPLYDTGPKSDTTGLVVYTIEDNEVFCAPWGASGVITANPDAARRAADNAQSDLLQNGCGGSCSSVDVTPYPKP